MDLCHVRCACMAGQKSVNKIYWFSVLGEGGGFRVFHFIYLFDPDSLPPSVVSCRGFGVSLPLFFALSIFSIF
ncbi:hypothetical protein Fmac_032581 [Flemingia macrophylla]|uniref:Uncharacterized protein n=1 Tax=Flemingia macrophylla TaxID=520843 RepID=A0ABD1L5B4_9FABA